MYYCLKEILDEKCIKIKIIFVIAVLFLYLKQVHAYTSDNDIKYDPGINLTFSDKVLTVAPHPDEESKDRKSVV
jgi:hypothetical protein